MKRRSAEAPYLVTGGCGFVGRNLCRHLIGLGHDIFIIDNLSTGQSPDSWLGPPKQVHTDGRRIYEILSSNRPSVRVEMVPRDLICALVEQLGFEKTSVERWPVFAGVFHLASIVGGRMKIDGDPLHVGLDLAIDALMFRWLSQNVQRVGRVLYASSSAAYPTRHQGRDQAMALREDMVAFEGKSLGQPDMTYGWSKLTGEYLAKLAAERYGLPVVSVRPFSGYGEEQDLSYPVPAIAQRVARGDNPIEIWGDGLQGRDFVHIDDCIAAMWRAQQTISDGSAVNIGTGRLVNFRELADMLLVLDKRTSPISTRSDKPVGVMSRFADTEKMTQTLGFSASISLEEGLLRVLKAARQRLNATTPQP